MLDSPGLIDPDLQLLTNIGGNAKTSSSQYQGFRNIRFDSLAYADDRSLFIVHGIDRLQTQRQRSRNIPDLSQGDSSCLHDTTNMTISNKECLDVASNAVTL
jgi:hypothetical protein